VEHLARHFHLDRGFGEQLGAAALLHEDRVVAQSEGALVAGLVALDQQLERRFGAFEGKAVGLELLDDLAQRLWIDAVHLLAELLGAQLGIGLAAQLADDEPHHVADHARIDVLVGAAGAGRRGAVDAALVGERGPADIRLVIVRGDVHDLGDVAGHLGQFRQAAGRNGLERGLELQVGEDADQVGVAAALAVAVDRALDVAERRRPPRPESWQRPAPSRCGSGCPKRRRLRHSAGGEVILGKATDGSRGRSPTISSGHGAAVGVAQDQRPGARILEPRAEVARAYAGSSL
jgi:hypothetical protein